MGNSGTDPSTNFIGTTDNQPLIVKVNGRQVFRLEPAVGTPNIIGGSSANVVSAGQYGAVIGGGGAGTWPNKVTGGFGTLLGGYGNTAGPLATVGGGNHNGAIALQSTVSGGENNGAREWLATVGGGSFNTAAGVNSTVAGGLDNRAGEDYATVGGGNGNTASRWGAVVAGGISNSATSFEASVAGGLENTASGVLATVGGGRENTTQGFAAAVPGGYLNAADGFSSFAAGRRAKAMHSGAFVWGDSTDADVSSTGADQFIARASGGTTFYSNSSLTAGVTLTPGGGSWSSLSDARVKEKVAAVDAQEILRGVASLPLSTWKYQSQNASIRHIGPMAQDFKKVFGVGEDERYITTVDADGVALAAIQGLNEKVEALQERLAKESKGQTTDAGIWQAAALLLLALGIGLAGRRGETALGG